MSKNLKANEAFINSLLDSERKNVRALLNSASVIQLRTLAEIFYNIGILPLDLEKRKQLYKYKSILHKFILEPKNRSLLVIKHYKVILKILAIIKPFIQIVLNEKV